MPNYRRWYVPGGTYFFTLVTYHRTPFLTEDLARHLLRKTLEEEQKNRPFTIRAIVLLPDHLHTIWILPPGDDSYSLRWSAIKGNFTRAWLAAGGKERKVSHGKQAEQRRGVWQPRFMEHVIRDESDLESHFHYLHYNPVKHGYVSRPGDWPWSNFAREVELGTYSGTWGEMEPPSFDTSHFEKLE